LVYRALTEYLAHRRRKPQAPAWMMWAPPIAFTLSLLWEPMRKLACFGAFAALIAMIILYAWLEGRRKEKLAILGKLESEQWLEQLAEYSVNGQLVDRAHPALLPELELCADFRQRVLNTLQGEDWNRLARQSGWADVRKTCQETADVLLLDALWAAKGAMRPPRGRRETFRRRCEDPKFASEPLSAVRLAREKLQTLYEEVHDGPFAAIGVRDALARAQSELQILRDAEREIRDYVGGMINDEVD